MKSTIILLSFILSLHFVSAQESARPVKQSGNVTLDTVINRLSEKHDINFIFEMGLLSMEISKLTLDAVDKLSLSEIIDLVQKETQLDIESVDGKNYSISKKKQENNRPLGNNPSSDANGSHPYNSYLGSSGQQPTAKELGSTVSGAVFDMESRPLAYITVSIRKTQDGDIVKMDLTDSIGRFEMDRIPRGSYYTYAEVIGGSSVSSQNFTLSQDTAIKIPTMTLENSMHELEEVLVMRRQPLVERKVDRMIVNVDNTALAAGGMIDDILKIAPGVSLDDEQISMRGKKGVIVMIDDRRVNLSPSDLTRMLENMPADQVKLIELITNPSARYDAEGSAGIINIVTKKNLNTGFSGSIVSGFRIGEKPKFNKSISLNFRRGKVTMFGNYTYSNNRNASQYLSEKVIEEESSTLRYDQVSNRNSHRQGNNGGLGLDYHFSENHMVGVLGTINTGRTSANQVQDVRYLHPINNGVDSSLMSSNYERSKFDTYSINMNSRHRFGEKDVLQFNADYLSYGAHDPNTYQNTYIHSLGESLLEEVVNKSSSNVEVLTGKLDYSHDLGENSRFEAGVKASYSKSSSDIRFENVGPSGEVSIDPLRTNAFDYKEYINAGYINFNGQLGERTEWQLGLRGENTKYDGVSLTTGEQINRSYFQVFPTAFLSHRLTEKIEIGFTYGRRIGRPDYADLNPFIDYASPLFYTQGNPTLLPETTHSFELFYGFDQKLNVSVGYSRTNDYYNYFTSISDPETGATRQTVDNFDNYDIWFLGINYGKDLFKWWNFNGNVNLYHERFQTPVLDEYIDMSMTTYDFNLYNAFKIGSKLTVDLLGIYRSPELGIARRIGSRYGVDVGARYNISDRLLLRGGVTDIFYSYINRGINTLGSLHGTYYNRNENRRFNISLSYRFGGQLTAPRKRTSNEDERDRIGN